MSTDGNIKSVADNTAETYIDNNCTPAHTDPHLHVIAKF